MDGCETQYNLYTKNCTGDVAVIHCTNKKQGGIQCNDCMQYWTANNSALTKLQRSTTNTSFIPSSVLSSQGVREMFEGNRNGDVILVQVQHYINYYEAASKLPLLNTSYTK
eukprot:1449955-Ditylum_brightwellii.AAC.1